MEADPDAQLWLDQYCADPVVANLTHRVLLVLPLDLVQTQIQPNQQRHFFGEGEELVELPNNQVLFHIQLPECQLELALKKVDQSMYIN